MISEKNHFNKYLLLIFFTGAVVLSLELLASRILTPFFGVSLYIWTSILSITLIFLAIGYQFGGWLTSKINGELYEDVFIFIPFLSSFFILISSIIYPILFPHLIGINLLIGSFIGSLVLLSVPLVLMSALNPILISIIKSKNDDSSDSKSGYVFFISTLGSVFGVIFTALFIIPNFTNFNSFILNALFLISINLLIYFLIGYSFFRKLKKKFIFLNILLFGILILILVNKENYLSYFTKSTDLNDNEYLILYEKPSFYGNLKVIGYKPKNSEEETHYILYQNGFTQNTVAKNGESLNTYIHVLNNLSMSSEIGNALVLGFGAGALPNYLESKKYNVDVVEIDPLTLSIATEYFNYKKKKSNIFFEDARTFVKKCKKKYDLIVIDLFFGDGVPEHLTTKEFYRDVKKCMVKDGILLNNTVVDLDKVETLDFVLSTFRSEFKNIYYFFDKELVEKTGIKITNLYVLVTDKREIKNLKIDYSQIPQVLRKRVFSTLGNIKKYETKDYSRYVIIDEMNNYSHLFAKSMSSFRKLISTSIPSRILIN